MPELPDIVVYVEALSRLLKGHEMKRVVVKSPFLLRTFDPTIEDIESRRLLEFSRIGKRIVWRERFRYPV